MSNQDAHQGGDLVDMAKDGTKIPGDAGRMNTIPSKPSTQRAENDLGSSSLHNAADNPLGTDDAITGTGDTISSSVFSKPTGAGGKERNHH